MQALLFYLGEGPLFLVYNLGSFLPFHQMFLLLCQNFLFHSLWVGKFCIILSLVPHFFFFSTFFFLTWVSSSLLELSFFWFFLLFTFFFLAKRWLSSSLVLSWAFFLFATDMSQITQNKIEIWDIFGVFSVFDWRK
jgi:hypothetical protein